LYGVEGVPRSVIFINWVLTFAAIVGSRILAQKILTHNRTSKSKKNNVIIYGSGEAGRQLSHALQLSNQYNHMAFVDDDQKKNGRLINSIPVFSSNKIKFLIKKYRVNEVLVAIPSISRKKRTEIVKKLKLLQVKVRSLPSVSKLTEGKINITDLLEIDIGDLLGREKVNSNNNLFSNNITNKVVFVSGAGGSIGKELCRQIIGLSPKKLILFDVSESSLYQIEQHMLKINESNIEIPAMLGSVTDFKTISTILKQYSVDTFYHAAAYKHVPLVEFNKSQGVKNNIFGTLYSAQAAISANVKTFVLISSDKAVRPTSTMGVTKRIAELILQAQSKLDHNTCFTMVRFGNVLDSSGSVIPLFKKQIKGGGPITLTDINMVRYFMMIPEAVELVIQAGSLAKGGDVFLLDMGEPVRIYDLALKMIRLSGLKLLDDSNPDGDIEIKYTGLRPGEKLYEELLIDDNSKPTKNKLIFTANEKMINWNILKPMLDELYNAADINDNMKIQELLLKIVPEYN
jgi:FlaA1/EpsC-like NDP-sugar epimerase